MFIFSVLLLLPIFSCRASDDTIAQQAATLFINKRVLTDQENPIAQQPVKHQPFLYMKTAKNIVLEALKLDPVIDPKNIKRGTYTPEIKGFGGNSVTSNPTFARIETVWQTGEKEPDIFLFYKAPGQLNPRLKFSADEAQPIYGTYSFNSTFYSSIGSFDFLDMSISPNGKYIAALDKDGYIKIMVNESGKDDQKVISTINFPNVKAGFSSGAVKWFNNGKKGYCALGTSLYEFSFDSFKTYRDITFEHDSKHIGQFTKADPKAIVINALSVESNTGESLYHNYCAIDYMQDNKAKDFVYSTSEETPDTYTVNTHLGERTLILSSANNMVIVGKINYYENVIKGNDIAIARNLKNLDSYSAVTVDEKNNAVYLFKNENQSKIKTEGFIPVLEHANFIPNYIHQLIHNLNSSIVALNRAENNIMAPEVVKEAVDKKYLMLKKDITLATDLSSIDANETAKDIIKKALFIYQTVWDKNMLLGPVIPTTQGAATPQPQVQPQPRPQPQRTLFQRLYNNASTWYTSLTNATKTRLKWFAGVVAAGAGTLGLTWLYSKANKGNIPAVYGKIPQLGQQK